LSIVPFSLPGRFWRGNLHTHSTLSDGALAPERAIEAYKDAGYDFIQLSDHFMERFNWPIADTRRWRSNNFTTLIGAELHAPATSVGELWHILAAGLPLDFAAPTADESGPELAARATAHGAFVAIAHPAWSQLTIEDGRSLGRACGRDLQSRLQGRDGSRRRLLSDGPTSERRAPLDRHRHGRRPFSPWRP
jgi:hypothetical protein